MKSEESLHLIDILILFSSKFDTVFLKIYFISWEYVALHTALSNLFGTREQFCVRQFFHGAGRVAGWVGGRCAGTAHQRVRIPVRI